MTNTYTKTISWLREHSVIILVAVLIPGSVTDLHWWLSMVSFTLLLFTRDHELNQ